MKSRFSGMVCLPVLLGVVLLAGCSRQQSDWNKAHAANNIEAYQQFLKNHPSGDFTAEAQARIRELEEERDWQKARDTDTPDGYQAFLKQYPEGKWAEEARIRIENFSLAQPPATASADNAASPSAAQPQGPVAATAGSGPSANTPVEPKARAPKAPAPKAAAGTTAGTGSKAAHSSEHKAGGHHHGVQLGAFSSGKPAAEHAWTRLAAAHPALLKGLKHHVVPVPGKAGSHQKVYKLQVHGLSLEHARSICHALTAKKQPCLIIAP